MLLRKTSWFIIFLLSFVSSNIKVFAEDYIKSSYSLQSVIDSSDYCNIKINQDFDENLDTVVIHSGKDVSIYLNEAVLQNTSFIIEENASLSLAGGKIKNEVTLKNYGDLSIEQLTITSDTIPIVNFGVLNIEDGTFINTEGSFAVYNCGEISFSGSSAIKGSVKPIFGYDGSEDIIDDVLLYKGKRPAVIINGEELCYSSSEINNTLIKKGATIELFSDISDSLYINADCDFTINGHGHKIISKDTALSLYGSHKATIENLSLYGQVGVETEGIDLVFKDEINIQAGDYGILACDGILSAYNSRINIDSDNPVYIFADYNDDIYCRFENSIINLITGDECIGFGSESADLFVEDSILNIIPHSGCEPELGISILNAGITLSGGEVNIGSKESFPTAGIYYSDFLKVSGNLNIYTKSAAILYSNYAITDNILSYDRENGFDIDVEGSFILLNDSLNLYVFSSNDSTAMNSTDFSSISGAVQEIHIKTRPLAEIDGTEVYSMSELNTLLEDGAELNLLRDTGPLYIELNGYSLSIDGEDFSVSSKTEDLPAVYVTGGGSLSFKNVTLNSHGGCGLMFNDGKISLTSKDDIEIIGGIEALSGDDISFEKGAFFISSDNSGINAGQVVVNGGKINIKSDNTGIISNRGFIQNGGEVKIKSAGEYGLLYTNLKSDGLISPCFVFGGNLNIKASEFAVASKILIDENLHENDLIEFKNGQGIDFDEAFILQDSTDLNKLYSFSEVNSISVIPNASGNGTKKQSNVYSLEEVQLSKTSESNNKDFKVDYIPYGELNRGTVIEILYQLSGQPDAEYECPFTDVLTSDSYYNAVCWAYSNKIISGFGNLSYSPAEPMSREQLAVIYGNYFKNEPLSDKINLSVYTFSDCSEISDWAIDSVQYCIGSGLMYEKGLAFDPKAAVTSDDFAAVIKYIEK